nr:type III restriction endonuclease subunit R [Chromatiaceae bacterium]
AARSLSPDLARTYAEAVAAQHPDADAEDEALMAAHVDIAALGLVPEVKSYLDGEAEKLANAWLTQHRVVIKALSDERQEVYRLIKGMSADPTDIDLTRPKSTMEATSLREADGAETPLPTYPHHLLCDENGTFPVVLNDWEREVLQAEMQRAGFVAWYRNPARATQDSLGIAYADNGQIKMVRPDFLFFARQADGRVVADLVDPHGTQFSDALPKLRGLAEYAAAHPHAFRRIETVARDGNKLRMLDLTDAAVRQAVAEGEEAASLYAGAFASDY